MAAESPETLILDPSLRGGKGETFSLVGLPLEKGAKSPYEHDTAHIENFVGPTSGILDSILDHIGYTPLVRINSISKSAGLECELLAKCEFFNAGGSVKDRIGKRMVLDAEKKGIIKKGDTLIEATSGNTGIGLALVAAVRGYKMVITLPEKMSNEKVNVLKALGAEVVRTPTEADWDSPDSHIGVAKTLNKKLQAEGVNSWICDQYNNPSNPLAHYDWTGPELLKQCGGQIDMLVVGAGTGGTITGCAAKIKEQCPNCIIVGVDPIGSILAQPETLNGPIHSFQVEGIGYDFVPKALNRKLVDHWIKTNDKDALNMSRRMIREEGLFCGGSCGTAMWAAVEACKRFKMGKGKRVVVLLADSVRNYMTKFLADEWMIDHKFVKASDTGAWKPIQDQWWVNQTVSKIENLPKPATVTLETTCGEAVKLFSSTGTANLPVVNGEEVVGNVSLTDLTTKMACGRVNSSHPVSEMYSKWFVNVSMDTALGDLSILFNSNDYAVVTTEDKGKQMLNGMATRLDLLNYITANKPTEET